ncbi:ATP-binding protein [Bacillus sp. SL00103]
MADLVDNSLDAKASTIKINFTYNDTNGMITINDNGFGMTEDMLQIAMSIGSKDPREHRRANELGRFGMGLKTASFSLGKRLSVLTKKMEHILRDAGILIMYQNVMNGNFYQNS